MNPSVSGIMVQKFWDTRFFTALLQHLLMHSSLYVPPQHFSLVGVWTLWLGHCNTLTLFFFSHSVVSWLLCFGSLFCWMNRFQSSFYCLTDDLTFDSRKQMSLEAQGLQSNHYPLLPCSAVFCDMLFQFCQMWHSSQSWMVQGRPVQSMLTAIVSSVLGFANIHAVWFYLSGFTVFGQICIELQSQPDSDFKEHIVITKWKEKIQSRRQTLSAG